MGGTRKNIHTRGTPFYFTATKGFDGGRVKKGGLEVKREKMVSYNVVKLVSLSKIVAGRVARSLSPKSL